MALPSSTDGLHRGVVLLGGLVLVVVCLSQARDVLVPLALALLLAFLLMPLVTALERRRLGRVPAVLVSVAGAFVLIGIAVWALTLELSALAREIPGRTAVITEKIESLRGASPDVMGKLQETWQQVNESIQRLLQKEGESAERRPMEVTIAPTGFAWFPKILGPFLEALAMSVLIVFLVVFMLIKREDLRNRVIRLVAGGRLTVATRALDEAAQRLSGFLLMQLVINVSYGLLFAFGLSIIGLPYAFLWGVIAAAFRFAPYIGPWLGLSLPLLYSVAFLQGWLAPVEVLGYFLILELLAANVAEPLLFSHSTGVSPVALLIAVIFWTWLWGPIGLVLSTPLTTCLYVLGRHVPQMEFLDVLLGIEPPLAPSAVYYQRLLAHDQDEASDVVEEQIKTQPLEKAFDEVLLPALVLAKRDRGRQDIGSEDEALILRTTRDVLQDMIVPQQQFNQIATPSVPLEDGKSAAPRSVACGCPASDEADEVALEMLGQLLVPAGCELRVASAKMLASEMIPWVGEQRPVAVCVGSLRPGGVAQARYLVKRLRARYPDLRILVGRWGQTENLDKVREQFRAAGADQVGTSLLESRDQIAPLQQLAPPAAAPSPPAPAATV